MTADLIARALVALLSAIAKLATLLLIRKGGRDAARAYAAEEQLKNVEDANRARDRLRADPDYAHRLRDRFTR